MQSSSRLPAAFNAIVYWLSLLALGIVAGLIVVTLTPIVSELSRKFIALGLLGVAVTIAAVASRRGRDVFLFVWIVLLTYNRQFWSFEPIFGDHGAFGPYWMMADLVLLVLLAQWLFEIVVLKTPQQPLAVRFSPWFAPFAIVATLSIVGAAEPAWALGDLARIFKLGLVLVYFRYNLGPRQWWVVIAALGTAVVIQSMFAVLEIATGRTGVLGVLGISDVDVGSQLGIEEIFGGWTRATGTVAHPPYLAAFFLLTVPVFMSLALLLPTDLKRWICIGVTGIGLVGLACTLTRMPIAVMLLQTSLLVLLLTALRQLPVTRTLALIAFAGLGASIIGIIGADFIYERFTSDFKESVDQRFESYRVAYKMLVDHALFGVGLNNYAAHMEAYGSPASWGITQKWHRAATDVVHLRILAGPLNGYLYVATVTGLAGLAALLWLAFGGLRLAWRAAMQSAVGNGSSGFSPMGAASFGMFIGMLGLFTAQITSYSIWIDTVITVWFVLIGLSGCALALARRQPGQ